MVRQYPPFTWSCWERGGGATSLGTATTVGLVSSDPSVATVPTTVSIPPGTSLVTVPVTTTRTPGAATIEARVQGLATSAATLTTVAAAESTVGGSIRLTVSPSDFFRGSPGPAWVTAELLNTSGNPERMSAPLTLDVISSAPSVLRPPPTITVPAGAYEVTESLQIGTVGAVTITALASGFSPGIATAEVETPGTQSLSLKATILPDVLLPGTAPTIVLQAVDPNGRPVPFPCGPVFLSSNNPAMLNVPATVTPTCSASRQAVVVMADAAGAQGTVSITVAASGMLPVTVQASVASVPPEILVASVAPLSFAYGQSPEGWLVLQTVLGKGDPADAVTAMTITLAGGAGAVPATATIPAGASSVAVPISGIVSEESPTVLATASGLTPAQITLTSAQHLLPKEAVGTGPAPTIAGHRIALRWIITVQIVAIVGLGLGIVLATRRRGATRR